MSPEDAASHLELAEPGRPTAFVDCMHFGFALRYPAAVGLGRPRPTAAWIALEQAAPTLAPALRERVARVVERHAEMVGALGLPRLVESAWSDLSSPARGRLLAGLSRGLPSPRSVFDPPNEEPCAPAGTTLEEALSQATLDAASAAEIGCNAIRAGRQEILRAVLDQADLRSGHVRRTDRGMRDDMFDRAMAILSVRPLEILLEAAVRLSQPDAARLLLDRGADPNIECWNLERSYNGHYSALSYSLHAPATGSPEQRRQVTDLLLTHGADPQGSTWEGRNCPLLLAFLEGDWELADRLLDLGARFEGGLSYVGSGGVTGDEPVINDGSLAPNYRRADLDLVRREVAPRVPLAAIGEVPLYHLPGAQGGSVVEFLHAFLRDDRVHRIDAYARRGLPTIVTPLLLLDMVRYRHDAALERLMPDELARAHVRRCLARK